MKCKICGGTAQIELRNHNIALCKNDFFDFFERRVSKTILGYKLFDKKDKILVAVSGGKDSLSLLYVLNKLGFNCSGLYIHLGIGEYSELSLKKCEAFITKYNLELNVFYVTKFFGCGIYEIAKKMKRNSCSICGIVKRYVMNRFGLEAGFSVLATGHNLDDESAQLFGSLLSFDLTRLEKEKIFLPSKEKALKKVKPFSLLTEREIAGYCIMNGIDYIYEECPYSKGATSLVYKSALNLVEERSPGTKLRFLKGFIEKGHIFKKVVQPLDDESKYCSNCGYLTYRDMCNFCVIADRLSRKDEVRFNFLNYIEKL